MAAEASQGSLRSEGAGGKDSKQSHKVDHESAIVVIAALVVNTSIFGAKLAAYMLSGGFDGAPFTMLAEVLHSLGDSVAQAFLLIGIYQATRKADKMFPLGYGRARFKWSFLASAFVIGFGLVMIFEGIKMILQGVEPHVDALSLGIFGGSALGEGAVWCIAFRGIQKARAKRRQSFREYFKETSNPSITAVLLEDSVAVVGITIALGAIALFQLSGSPVFDGIGSILIGLLVVRMGTYLWNLNSSLLIGRSNPYTERTIRTTLEGKKEVKEIKEIIAVWVGADQTRAQVTIVLDADVVQARLMDDLNGDAEKLTTDDEGLSAILKRHAELKDKIMDRIELALRRECLDLVSIVIEEELEEEYQNSN